MKIKVHPELCEAQGVCHRFAGSVYELDDEGFLELRLLEVPPELEAAALLGADLCLARAISVLHAIEQAADEAGPVKRQP